MSNVFKKLCRIAGEAVVKYQLISDGDRILVGVSGGKDSLVLMHVLEHLHSAAPVDFTFEAVTFDPGFPEFAVARTAEYCKTHNWKHHIVPLDIASVIAEKSFERSPCVLCSRLRRGKLYGEAKKLNCNKLALGQHLDDIVSSLFISLCRGQGVTTMAPLAVPDNPEHPTVIRPLALVPEQLIIEYAATLALPEAGVCRYKKQLESGDRVYFKQVINDLAGHIPDLRSNIAHSLTRVEIDHLLIPPGNQGAEK
ncbi:MAG: tRNA 2-thiocytidine(32) synthetase TtcA [Lentisphaerae bacterium]|nr:tRNA 2-thiocytidine(32) synthetase TtcA [Lentisphaerota bacterium]